jgi:hypothetical protein
MTSAWSSARAARSRARLAASARMARSVSRLNPSRAVQHARLTAHQERADTVRAHRRKDSAYPQTTCPGRDRSIGASRGVRTNPRRRRRSPGAGGRGTPGAAAGRGERLPDGLRQGALAARAAGDRRPGGGSPVVADRAPPEPVRSVLLGEPGRFPGLLQATDRLLPVEGHLQHRLVWYVQADERRPDAILGSGRAVSADSQVAGWAAGHRVTGRDVISWTWR